MAFSSKKFLVMVLSKNYKPLVRSVCCKNFYYKLMPSEDVVDGKIVKSSQFKKFDFCALNKDFTSSDFNVSNLIAVGAQNLLTPMSLPSVSPLSLSDQFQQYETSKAQTVKEA